MRTTEHIEKVDVFVNDVLECVRQDGGVSISLEGV